MKTEKAKKPLCYVIGPIDSPDSEVRRDADMLYHSIIEQAVGEKYQLLRADKEHKSGMITNMIIQRVHDAEVVIADLTTLNPNAFYELGIRHAAKKPTIHVAQNGTPLPFDTAGYNTIFYDVGSWNSHVETRKELEKQLAETEEPNYTPSNPVTQALTMQVFNASPDSEEKTIALLTKRVAQLERMSNTYYSRKRKVEFEDNPVGISREKQGGEFAILEDILAIAEHQGWEIETKEMVDIANIIQKNTALNKIYQEAVQSSRLSKLADVIRLAKEKLPY